MRNEPCTTTSIEVPSSMPLFLACAPHSKGDFGGRRDFRVLIRESRRVHCNLEIFPVLLAVDAHALPIAARAFGRAREKARARSTREDFSKALQLRRPRVLLKGPTHAATATATRTCGKLEIGIHN